MFLKFNQSIKNVHRNKSLHSLKHITSDGLTLTNREKRKKLYDYSATNHMAEHRHIYWFYYIAQVFRLANSSTGKVVDRLVVIHPGLGPNGGKWVAEVNICAI